jgi:hypothetical protein
MHSQRRLAQITIYALLACLPGAAVAPSEASDNRTTPRHRFEASFISLKPGHSIAPAVMELFDNATLAVSIANEPLREALGRYRVAGMRFEADYSFALQRRPHLRYHLILRGVMLLNTYILGRATLQEFLPQQRLTQEIPFVFVATTPQPSREQRPRMRPFF